MPDVSPARELVDAVIAAFAVLGGFMSYSAGLAASTAESKGARGNELADAVAAGMAEGFRWGVPLALVTLILVGWT